MKTTDLMQRQKNAETELLWLIPYSTESEEYVDRSNQPTQQGIFLLWSTQNSHPRKGESQRMVQIQHVGWQKTQLFHRHKMSFIITQKIFKTCSKNNLTSILSFCTNTWSQVWCWIMYSITTGSAIASEPPKFSATQAAGTDTTCVNLGYKNWTGGSRDKSSAYTHYNFSSTSLLTDHPTHTMMQTNVTYASKLLLSCMNLISGVLWQSVLAFWNHSIIS